MNRENYFDNQDQTKIFLPLVVKPIDFWVVQDFQNMAIDLSLWIEMKITGMRLGGRKQDILILCNLLDIYKT